MKTILQVHIFVRLCASAGIVYSVFRLIVAWPQVARIREVMEKQKENIEMMGGSFDMSAFIPSFAEIFIGSILMLMAGLFGFLGTRKIVEIIIGPQQIKELLHLDRKSLNQ